MADALTIKMKMLIGMDYGTPEKHQIKKQSITGTTNTLSIDYGFYEENKETALQYFSELGANLQHIFLGTFDDFYITTDYIVV